MSTYYEIAMSSDAVYYDYVPALVVEGDRPQAM